MPSYEDFKKDVLKAIDTWIDSLQNGHSRNKVEDLKLSASDLIEGWKSAYPAQIKNISNFVNDKINDRFANFK